MKNGEYEYRVVIKQEHTSSLEEYFIYWRMEYSYLHQLNIYYDTIDNDLHKLGLSLIIKHIKNKNIFIASLKEKLPKGKQNHKCEIDNKSLNSLPNEIKEVLLKHGITIESLIEVATLETKRNQYQDSIKRLTFCVDLNSCSGINDCELVVKGPSFEIAKNEGIRILNLLKIPFEESKYLK